MKYIIKHNITNQYFKGCSLELGGCFKWTSDITKAMKLNKKQLHNFIEGYTTIGEDGTIDDISKCKIIRKIF